MDLKNSIALIDLHARLDLKAEASRYHLNYLWWILEPVMYVLVFYTVFKTILASPQEEFLLFLMCGKIPFLWFSKAINGAASSIVASRGLIAQAPIPKIVFPHAKILENTYRQWLTFLLLFGLAISFGHFPSIQWLWIGPIFATQLIITQAAGILGALLVSFYEDFRPLIQLATLFLMFGSGVFWDINSIPDAALRDLVPTINPIAFLIDAYRTILMGDGHIDAIHLSSIAILAAVALLGLHSLYGALDKVIARRVI